MVWEVQGHRASQGCQIRHHAERPEESCRRLFEGWPDERFPNSWEGLIRLPASSFFFDSLFIQANVSSLQVWGTTSAFVGTLKASTRTFTLLQDHP